MRGKEGAADKDQVSEGKAKEEEATTAPLPEKVGQDAKPVAAKYTLFLSLPADTSTSAGHGWRLTLVYCREEAWERRFWSGLCWSKVYHQHFQGSFGFTVCE